MVFGYEFEDVVDVHFDLFDQFGFEDDVVVDDLLVGFLMRTPLLVEIDVQALVVLQVAQAQHIFVGEIVEGLQDVAQHRQQLGRQHHGRHAGDGPDGFLVRPHGKTPFLWRSGRSALTSSQVFTIIKYHCQEDL